jgi:uncharacterized OB-fold protein
VTHTLNELVTGITPIVIDETRAFWEATARDELVVQTCNACGTKQLPGGPCCTTCLSQDLAWERASGRGTVFSFTVVHHAFHPSFAERVPYVVADVQLEEGPILTTNVTDVAPEDVRIGMPVRAWFDELVEDAFHVPLKLPKFRPLPPEA